MFDLWRAGERVRICAVHIWLISKKGLDCVDLDAASSASPLREKLSPAMWTEPDGGGWFRLQANICRSCARPRCMMCPPCRQTSSRFTSCYNKSQKNYLNRKDELAVRRIRPSLSSTKAFQAELFSDSSVKCLPLVLSPVTACFTKKKHHMTLSILSLSGSAWTVPWTIL